MKYQMLIPKMNQLNCNITSYKKKISEMKNNIIILSINRKVVLKFLASLTEYN
jgi:hypothetical protein